MLTIMRFGCCAILALSACYAPTVLGGAPCDPNRDSCPAGQTCQATGSGNFCSSGRQADIDAGVDSGPMPTFCYGSAAGLLGKLCFKEPPTGAVALSATTPINTASVTAGGCTELRPQTGGPALCIIAGASIDIPATATFRAIVVNQSGATTSNPLVLIATQSITVEGTLDVASHVGAVIAGMPVLGAGARTAVGCAAIGLDGAPGKPATAQDSFGGGGGAGGSFGSTGGAGGSGGNNNNVGHGNPVAGSVPSLLVGGCPGGNGGNGDGALTGGGLGGGGGGAIFLLAGDSITVSGKINASGAGGDKGTAGMFSSGGGGGGGAGGMIGLDALHITVTGSLFANGGGGASGSGGNQTDSGTSGSDPSVALTAAPGGGGNDGGGGGGAGSTASATGAAGKNGSGGSQEAAGGGGGGGAGAIRVFGVPPASLTGSISPPAT
jgi:hypothetical protein